MKHGRSKHTYGVLALAARAALRFAARRNASNRHDAWRPVALFWRQKRKGPEGVRASRVAPAAGAVWLPQFHLHFITRMNDHPRRDSMLRLSPVVAIHQGRVVMDHQRTIVQSSMYAAQPRRAQRPTRVFSLRHARSDSGTKVQAAAPYSESSRRPIVPPTSTWVTDRAQRPHLGRTHQSVRLGTSQDAQAQTFQAPQIYKRELLLFRSRSVVMSNAVPPRSPEGTAPQFNFGRPQELVWRRAMQPSAEIAVNERQLDPRELSHQAQGRSFPGKEAASGMSHPSGSATALPAMKIDSVLMDRLADDVIRRVEQRARINRERRGL